VIYKALRNDYQVKLLNELNTLIYSADSINDFNAVRRGLGGQFLLEGYIRREKDELLLHLLLVDAQSSQQVWARKYQFEPTQSLRIKAKVASDVVAALKSKFSSDQRTNLSFESTKNPDAYALYLQGRQLERNPASSVSSYENAESFYRQAVALDPEYALAHARLAIMAGALYRFRSSSKELQMLSLSEAKKALRLAPSLAEAHLAMALYYYRVERNFDSALSELSTAQRCFPNDGEVEATRAYVYRRQARWHEALLEQYDALARDPINQDYERELQVTACLLRDWHRAADHAARAVALSPKLPHLLGERALISYWSDGNLKPLRNFFQALVGFGDEEGNLTWSQWDAALLSREFTSAELALQNFPRDTLPSVGSGPIPKTYLQGCSYLAQGDQPRANIFFQRAKPFFEAEIAGHPNDAMRHARLGLLYAYMGRKEDAIREGTRATEITPVWEDAVEGHQWLCNLALIHARVGNSDEAIQMIESLLREPGCVSPLNEACMTLWDLRLRWQWDPLRKDPRFQKILNDPEPATAY
jgi:Tfp pilus assembly protein PilF